MRVGLSLASLGAAIIVAFAGPGVSQAAVDNEQFCQAMQEIARFAKADIGRWIDRVTRDDGIDVLCAIRTVNYKRFVNSSSAALGPGWRERKQQEWNSIACTSAVLRDAIDNGWIITSAIATATGERVLVIATCK